MERKRKNRRIASATDQEIEPIVLLDVKGQSNVAFTANSERDDSPLCDTATSLNRQYHSVIESPHVLPNIAEQLLVPVPSPLPASVSQWQQLPNMQLHPQRVQPGPSPSPISQSTMPIWNPHLFGYSLSGVNVPAIPPPFAPIGTISSGWHVPAIVGGGTSSENHPQVSYLGYQYGHSYPGFPGSWGPSSWWHSRPPCTYTVPGACSYFCSQPPNMPSSATSPLQSVQRGIIRPPEKLSQKHRQLWEAQSAENVQLWTIIGELQSELADYKGRVMKLEAKVQSVNQAAEKPIAHVTETSIPKKRGRLNKSATSFDALPYLTKLEAEMLSVKQEVEKPTAYVTEAALHRKTDRPKKSSASIDAPPSHGESQPRAQVRQPEPCKLQTEAKAYIIEKIVLNKIENEEQPLDPAVITEKDDENASNKLTDRSFITAINGTNLMMPPIHNPNQQEMLEIQICGAGLDYSLDIESYACKTEDPNIGFTEDIDNKGALASFFGEINNRNLEWPCAISSEDNGKNVLNMSSQFFYDNGSVIQLGGKVISGWNLVNEEGATNGLVAKDENEEMGDGACARDEGPPHISNW